MQYAQEGELYAARIRSGLSGVSIQNAQKWGTAWKQQIRI